MARYNTYTAEQEGFLRKHHFGRTRKELTDLFNQKFRTNKTVLAIKSWCNNRGLHNGNDGKFTEGNVSWQTGLSKKEYMKHFTNKSFARSIAALMDKRVHDVGDTIIRHGIPYVITRVEPNTPIDDRIKAKRRFVYEQAYGEIPEGHRIIQLDGDQMNCELDNLYCVPDKYIPVLNKNHWLTGNKDITLAAIKWCELFNALKRKEFSKNGNSTD